MTQLSLCSEETFYDTKVFVYENSAGNLANTLNGTGACNDDYCSNSHQSYISFISGVTLFAGNTYYFVVDGWNGEFGDYDLNIYEHQSEYQKNAEEPRVYAYISPSLDNFCQLHRNIFQLMVSALCHHQ